MSLQDYGWTEFFSAQFAPYTLAPYTLAPYTGQGYAAGRVVLVHRQLYHLYTADGEVTAEVSGRLLHLAGEAPEQLPAIGDWVVLRPPVGGGTAQVHAVLERRSQLTRKEAGARTAAQVVAANVDTVFLVMGLDGDYNPRRLERLLTMAWESGAQPVVALTKADLCADVAARQRDVEAVSPGVPVAAVSALAEHGVDELAPFLEPRQTVALVGSSGVGKSTLINRLCGRELLRTGAVRAGDDRGQHTTTHRQLVRLPGGALLIDNPGIRELQLWSGEEGIGGAFDDVEALASSCRFRDCRHHDEPGCAVRAAVDAGRLDGGRLANLHALEKELRYLELRRDDRARRAEKKRVAAIHKAAKRHKPRG